MNQQKLFSEVLECYYGETAKTLEDIAKKHGVSIAECEHEWQKIELVSQRFRQLEEQLPTQLSTNKIMAFAAERNREGNRHSFWQWLWQPAYGLSVLVVCLVSVLLWQRYGPQQPQVAEISDGANQVVATTTSPLLKQLITTTFDHNPEREWFASQSGQGALTRPYLVPNAMPASIGSQPTPAFEIDESFAQRLLKGGLNAHELELLFFRARKMEKLSYFREALNDYLMITKYYPLFAHNQTMPLAIARCYEKLGNKKTAIDILEDFQKKEGRSEDVQLWIDLLKSETF